VFPFDGNAIESVETTKAEKKSDSVLFPLMYD